jgi:hypothetical protein
LGWPLALASVGGIAAGVVHVTRRGVGALGPALARLRGESLSDGGTPTPRDHPLETVGVVLALAGIATMSAVYSTWAFFRTHHLLPMFPLAILLVALAFQWLDTGAALGGVDTDALALDRTTVVRSLAVVLVVTTAVYAGVGTLGYATQSRDEAVSYLQERGGQNATVETYAGDSQEAAVPHGWEIYRPTRGVDPGQPRAEWMQNIEHRCPDYVVLNYQRAMLWLAPDDHSQLADRWADPDAEAFLRDLLATEGPYNTENAPYPYEVAETFGRQPPFVEDGDPFDPTWDMVRAGIFPRTIQYGDPQDFGVYGFAAVLERTGSCDAAG